MNRYATFAAAILFAALSAQAAEESIETNETVIVTGSHIETTAEETTAAVTVITREDIARSNARNVADLLRRVPGLFVAQSGATGAVTSAFVRGSNSNQTLVLLDGVPLNEPSSGRAELAHLPLDRVERIEIVRGTGSVVHGSNAGGGVIHVLTRRAAKGETRAAASLAAGHNETHAALASAEFGFDGAALALSLSSDATENDFPHNGYERQALMARLDAAWGDSTRMSLTAHRASARFEQGPMYSTFSGAESLDANTETRDRHGVYAVRFVTEPDSLPRWRQDVSLSFRTLRRPYRNPADTAFDCDQTSANRAWSVRVNVAEQVRWSENAASVVGAELSRLDGANRSVFDCGAFGVYPSAFDADLENRALFFEQRWRVNGFTLEASTRHDRYRQESDATTANARDEATTYRVGLAQRFPDAFAGGKLRMTFASSFRYPSFDELFFPFFGVPTLRPERGQSVEVGWDQRLFDGKTALSFTLYRNRYRDLIQTNLALFAPENVPSVRMEGAEFSWEQEITRGFRAAFAYHYLDARNLTDGVALLRRPRHAGSLRLAYVGERFDVGVEAFRAGTRPDIKLTFPATVYHGLHPTTLVSAFGSVRVGKGVSATFRATNLLDENYEDTGAYPAASRGKIVAADATGFPLLRRAWMLGLKAEWGR